MRRVKNWLNADQFPTIGEVNRKPSLTVPDQSMSIAEILHRFSRGLEIGGGRVPLFDEDDDLPDIRTLDLSEREDLARSYKAELEDLTKPKPKIQAKKPVSEDQPPVDPKSTNIT